MEVVSLERIKLIKTLKKVVLPAFIILVLLILLAASIYKVDSGQAVVVTRFGRVARVNRDAGISLKIPFIEKANKVSLEKRYQIEYGYRTLEQGSDKLKAKYEVMEDEQTVIVEAVGNNSSIVLTELIVEYHVSDPVNYLFKVNDLENTIRLVLEDTLRNVIQSATLDQALTNKHSIDSEIKPEIQRVLNLYEAGINIIEVKTQNTSLLPSVDVAYREVEKANQYRNAKLEEAQKYINTVIPQAEAEAIQLIEDAKGYKATAVAKAKSEAAEFKAIYNEYKKNPEIIREKIYTESMKELLRNNNVVIDTTAGDSSLYKFFNMNDNKDNAKKAIVEDEGSKIIENGGADGE